MPKCVVHLRGSNAMLGAERVVLELASKTREFGYESVLVALQSANTPEPELVQRSRAAGIATYVLSCRGRFDPTVFGRLRRLLHAQRADLLHCHGYKENFYGLPAAAGLPVVTTNHLWKRTSPALKFYCWLDAKLSRRFDHVIAVSEPIRQELLAAGVAPQKISRIINGIDVDPYQRPLQPAERQEIRQQLGIKQEQLALVMLSRLGKEKGHTFAIQALAELKHRFPHAVLLIVGAGPELGALQKEVAERGLASQVRFCGQRSDVDQILRAVDAFLMPSLLEGLPMALLEAMAAGLPSIASRVGDIDTVIEHDQSGLLVPPADVSELVSAMTRLLSDASLRQRLGQSACHTIAQRFSSRQMALLYCQLYDRLQQAPRAVAQEQET